MNWYFYSKTYPKGRGEGGGEGAEGMNHCSNRCLCLPKCACHSNAADCVTLAMCFLDTKHTQGTAQLTQSAPVLNPPPISFKNQRLSHFIALSALSSQTRSGAGGEKVMLGKLNTPTARAEKEIQHSENRAPFSISRNKPAVVLCLCVKITDPKQEMLT